MFVHCGNTSGITGNGLLMVVACNGRFSIEQSFGSNEKPPNTGDTCKLVLSRLARNIFSVKKECKYV